MGKLKGRVVLKYKGLTGQAAVRAYQRDLEREVKKAADKVVRDLKRRLR